MMPQFTDSNVTNNFNDCPLNWNFKRPQRSFGRPNIHIPSSSEKDNKIKTVSERNLAAYRREKELYYAFRASIREEIAAKIFLK